MSVIRGKNNVEINPCKRVKVVALVLAVFVCSVALFCSAEHVLSCDGIHVSGKMIKDLAESSKPIVEEAGEMKPVAFMVACLVMMSASLGMVLLNIKRNRSENDGEDDFGE